MIPAPRNILVSFHYYARYDLEKLAACRIVGDSGAFTAKASGTVIETKQLAAWAKQWEHRLAWVAALDDIGDQDATRRNWLELVEDYGVPGIPTIHCGEPPEAMDFYAARGVDFMGLGGLAGKAYSEAAMFRWIVRCFKYARDNHPQMRFHGWGVTKPDWVRLPWFSVDSSGWSSSYRYARLALRHPHTGKTYQFQLNGKDVYRPDIVSLLRDHYGVNPSEIATSGPHNRALLVRLSALSASVGEQQMRKLHRRNPVSPPMWGRLGGFDFPPGPNQALAVSASGKNYGEEIAELSGPHQHLTTTGTGALAQINDMNVEGPHQHLAMSGGQYEDDTLAELNGPHSHLALNNRQGPADYEGTALAELNGPHTHLVDTCAQHLEWASTADKEKR